MKTLTKKVYYCDYCNKHRLVSNVIKDHEEHCTLNPNRLCGMCGYKGIQQPTFEVEVLGEADFNKHIAQEDIDKIEKEFDCPICVLAFFRINFPKVFVEFDWKTKALARLKADRDEENSYLY